MASWRSSITGSAQPFGAATSSQEQPRMDSTPSIDIRCLVASELSALVRAKQEEKEQRLSIPAATLLFGEEPLNSNNSASQSTGITQLQGFHSTTLSSSTLAAFSGAHQPFFRAYPEEPSIIYPLSSSYFSFPFGSAMWGYEGNTQGNDGNGSDGGLMPGPPPVAPVLPSPSLRSTSSSSQPSGSQALSPSGMPLVQFFAHPLIAELAADPSRCPCDHVSHWKHSRFRRRFAYFSCLFCGAKWRVPYENTGPSASSASASSSSMQQLQ